MPCPQQTTPGGNQGTTAALKPPGWQGPQAPAAVQELCADTSNTSGCELLCPRCGQPTQDLWPPNPRPQLVHV